jgi:hypothetical protein
MSSRITLIGVFDPVKNNRLDKTILVILCLILKLFLTVDKLRVKGQDKNFTN